MEIRTHTCSNDKNAYIITFYEDNIYMYNPVDTTTEIFIESRDQLIRLREKIDEIIKLEDDTTGMLKEDEL